MWPFIGNVVKTILKTNVEPHVSTALPSSLTPFQFQTVDLGSVVSVIVTVTRKRAIALQLEASGAMTVLFRFNYDARPSLKLLKLSIAVL